MGALTAAGREFEPRSRLRSPAGVMLGVAIAAALTALFTSFAEARALPPTEEHSDMPAVAPPALTSPLPIAPPIAAVAVTDDSAGEAVERSLRALHRLADHAPPTVEASAATASDAASEASPASDEPAVLAASTPPSPIAAPPPPPSNAPATSGASVVPPSPEPATAIEAVAPTLAEPRFELTVRARGLLEAMNREREAAGIAPLRLDATLIEVARERSRDMAENNYFAHFGPNGESTFALVSASGRRFSAIGENLARVRGDEGESVRFAITNLMASAPHRRNILKQRYTLVGVAAVQNAIGLTVFTTVFAAE